MLVKNYNDFGSNGKQFNRLDKTQQYFPKIHRKHTHDFNEFELNIKKQRRVVTNRAQSNNFHQQQLSKYIDKKQNKVNMKNNRLQKINFLRNKSESALLTHYNNQSSIVRKPEQ